MSSSAHAASLSFLHTRGQDVVDEKGQKVLLRGVGLGNWLLPEGYMWKLGREADRPRRIEKLVDDLLGPENARRFWSEFRNNYITEADIQRIAALGYNSVRPALNSRLFLSDTGQPTGTEEGFRLLDNLVAWCKASGVYVIVDMHGAPGGQTGQNIDDSAHDQPELFTKPEYQQQLLALWQALAKRYKDAPAVAGYDLLNEPLPARTGAARSFKTQLEPLYQRIARTIREVDSKHILILEGCDWANDWSVFTKPFDPNLVYQFHYYCWDTPVVLKTIQPYLDRRRQFNAPVWVGETGESDNAIYWATTEYFEANNIGWCFWPWKKMDTRNTPLSIKVPADWEAITAYSRGGDQPSRELAQRAFDELLVNLRLTNCVFLPDVVNAMFRRVPCRIEAENYGQDGPDRSYFVKDTHHRSEFYRPSEPVPITARQTYRRQADRFVTLQATEWTAYNVWSDAPGVFEVTAKAKATVPAKAQLLVGDQLRAATISPTNWTEIKLGEIALNRGANQLKWLVTGGVADLDWLELTPVPKTQQSASRQTQ